MRKLSVIVVVVLLSLFATAIAQETLNNEAVVKMVKAGLGEDLIVNMINSQPGTYRTSTNDVIALKNQGVSDKVISAMVKRKDGGAVAAPTSSATLPAASVYPTEIGVYYKKDSKWLELQPEVVNWKTGGIFKSIASAGIVKGDINGHIVGKQSRTKLGSPLEILIYAPEGVAITEYQFLRLRENKSNREFRTVTGGVLHAKSGATRDLQEFEGQKVASRTFLISLSTLAVGEYGFLPPGAFVSSSAGSSLGKIYSFSIPE